jgi:hypothetical protein
MLAQLSGAGGSDAGSKGRPTGGAILVAARRESGRSCRGDGRRSVWKVSAIIEAAEDAALAAQEAIARTLCPNENHPGYSPVPWTTMVCRFDDLDAEERAEWVADFAKHSLRAGELGEPGA